MTTAQAYTPLPLNPLQTQIVNALLTRELPHGFDLSGTPCSFKAEPWQTPFTPACGLDLNAQGETWRILFSSASLLRLHPAGTGTDDDPRLPEALKLALLELLFAPVLKFLADFFGFDKQPSIMAEYATDTSEFACYIPMTLCLPEEKIAVAVYVPSETSAEALLRRLMQKERKRNSAPALVFPVALETGFMRLSLPELAALQIEDILLPETYYGNRNELCLRPTPELGIRCSVAEGNATVLGLEHTLPRPLGRSLPETLEHSLPEIAEKETRRETMADTLPGTASHNNVATPEARNLEKQSPEHAASFSANGADAPPHPAINPDALEVTVTFELERRLMSMAEITAMTPGYTFTLTADMSAPVTVRANGQTLGTGRLVDVGGVLGVQLTSLEQGN